MILPQRQVRMYSLQIAEEAEKEWKKLGPDIRDQFKKKLGERQKQPRIPGDALHNMPDCYKIKLRAVGYRLVYRVIDGKIRIIRIIAVGKRDKKEVYTRAMRRLQNQ